MRTETGLASQQQSIEERRRIEVTLEPSLLSTVGTSERSGKKPAGQGIGLPEESWTAESDMWTITIPVKVISKPYKTYAILLKYLRMY